MNPLSSFCLIACLVAAALATSSTSSAGNHATNTLKPSEWLSQEELQKIPALDDFSMQKLSEMSVDSGAEMVNTVYHLARASKALAPVFVPSPSNVPVVIVQSNGQKVQSNLKTLSETAKQQPNFGSGELIVYITGYSEQIPAVKKAQQKLIQAVNARRSVQQQRTQQRQQQQQQQGKDYASAERTSSEENYSDAAVAAVAGPAPSVDLAILKLGESLNNAKRLMSLNVPATGAMIGQALAELTNEAGVTPDAIHIVAEGIAAHVAGAAGRQYTRLTGHQVRRISALDPARIYAKKSNTLPYLSRGDAEFVDAIHTSAYGLGTARAVGDVDFYPNGPSEGVAGADNVVEAAMRATRYFAESVRPGNERNFPAVAANTIQQYQSNNGIGNRAYMGYDTDVDAKGTYMLQVNDRAPFGRRSPAQKQNVFHAAREGWKNSHVQDYE